MGIFSLRYKLRTLLIVLGIAPPVLAACWWAVKAFPDTAPFIIVFGFGGFFPFMLRWVKTRSRRPT